MSLDTILILSRYLSGEALEIVVTHSIEVTSLASSICNFLQFSKEETLFVQQAAMLHDIGVCRVNAPELGLVDRYPYIMHGILGREILESEGLSHHALVCERHIGVGLTVEDIKAQHLPLPLRDMTPQTIAEEIVCFADLFYSKQPGKLNRRKSISRVRKKLERFGAAKIQIFDSWILRFGNVL